MSVIIDDHLAHYGILRKSGRYPWGSGEDAPESTRNRDLLDAIAKLRNDGLTEAEIAKGLGFKSTTELRAVKTIAVTQQRQEKIAQAERLREKGYSNVAIGQRMGINESSVRALLAPGAKDKTDVLQSTADMLKRQVAEKKYIDVGHGVETSLPLGLDTAAPIGISREKLNTAVAMLQEEGYKVHYLKIPQVSLPGQFTSRKVLSLPDVPYSEVYANRGNIKLINEHSPDFGRTYEKLRPPINISSRRIDVRYAEDGGAKADGMIYVRPGAKDLSLGQANYAQVRIAVDGTHYLKGMAIYKDDLPDGVDIVYNVNKKDTGRKKDAFKEFEKDIDGNVDKLNPFGADIKPGGQRGAFNIINEEGDWDTWSRNLSSQVLSKQSPALARTQLNMTYERRQTEFADIKRLTNPAVRKKLLETFADETDSAAVHLQAAALPRQTTRIILPISSMKPNQIYSPAYRDGERVVLIRFPHAGTFEIPELTVNNRNREARKILGTSDKLDAVGIHHKVAERLSGADFDGDFVLVIPNNKRSIKSTPALDGLKGFDPQHSFPEYPGMVPISGPRKQQEMGKITNLIADMSLRGATSDEMARAVRHSMVVIDSEKHNLDYRGSEKANGIKQLKEKYQKQHQPGTKGPGGASTLITRATSEKRVPERKLRRASRGGPVDPVTGKLVYEPTGATYVNKRGATKGRTTKTTKLADTDDAFTLSSGHPMEAVYAEHSNKLKATANEARKEALHTQSTPMSKSAKATYAPQVESLNAKLNLARMNAPLERQAQSLANTAVSQKRQARPDLDPDHIKKIRNQELETARIRTGAKKNRIKIEDDEWAAIQAGAISNSKLKEILDNADLDRVRQLATPRVDKLMTSTKITRAKAMAASGATQAEIADALGVSLTTLKIGLKG
jgi:DNA-binding CsgD family transcriptional regulator